MHVLLTFVLILFPIGGIVGDACLGRYKTVVGGLLLATISTLIASIASVLILTSQFTAHNSGSNLYQDVLVIVLDVTAFPLYVFGISALNSNINQFGLDQLMEKPSEIMGVFVHWLVWAIKLGENLIRLINMIALCTNGKTKTIVGYLSHGIPVCYFVLLVTLLLIAYCTRHHFNRDRVKYNPYKMIFKVLNFARKNKYPIGPISAFAYCSDFRPSRLDYAKERYGGPFTTSDVEDVKSFRNVFLVMLALSPVFILDAPTETYFKKFSSHMGFKFPINTTCDSLSPGSFTDLIMLVALPVYIWLIYSVFRNSRPKILHRLIIFVLFYVLALVSMLLADLTGHLMLLTQNQPQAMCMFVNNHSSLDIHWTVLVAPSVMSQCHSLIMATVLEFVSAQSPHTMIGVLVGTFYALIGIFRFLGILFLIPFALEGIWGDGYLRRHPPVISCGFGYYLVCTTTAIVGFILFIIAVKRYTYRRRDEEPYSQACVEEIFARRIKDCYQHTVNREDYEELPDSSSWQNNS